MRAKGETDYTLFDEISKEICSDERFIRLTEYIAHSDVTVYAHSITVARRSYAYAVNRKIRCDVRSLIRGALLHDYFLYDWHKMPKFTFHGFKHARIARENADRDFGLNSIEKNIIESHMFPLNLLHFPKCREAWIVTVQDKICAIKETFKPKGKRNDGT